jgi:aryl-alcohol dehydrogenase-like predicted oxidoreductase
MLRANGMVNERTIANADAVKRVADELGVTPAQTAIAWTLVNPAVVAPMVGARTLRQLDDNIGALSVRLGDSHLAALHAASRIELGFPHDFLKMDFIRSGLSGGTKLRPRG